MRHGKSWAVSSIILILVLCNIGLIVNIGSRNERHKRMAESLMLINKYYYILENNSLFQFKYNDRILSDFIIMDVNNTPHNLSSIFNGDEFKLILKVSNKNCTPCIDIELENLYRMSERIGMNKIIVLCEYDNIREFSAYFKTFQYPFACFYTESGNFHDILEQENVPFVFIMDRNLRIRNLFIPSKDLTDYSNTYYSIMAEKYWK